MRTTFLPFAQPDFDGSELAELQEVLHTGWVTTGPKAQRLEKEFAERVEAPYAVAVNSCTAALHLALEALGVARGDEVITTTYTFAATAEVVRYFDARPVLVDVEARSLNIDLDQVEAAITPRTKAILPVHFAGLPADMDALRSIARRHNLPVLEDAAHAFPARYRGKMVGNLGDVTCFSFYATKTITTGEGGMICTGDERIAARCRQMSLHGISRDAWKRYTSEGSWYYEIEAPGFKYNLPDLAAALGLAQLRKADRMRERRSAIARRYDEAFRTAPELEVPFDRAEDQHAWHLYPLRLHLDRLRLDRGAFVEELKKRNIGTSVHFIPLHLHPYYRKAYGYAPEAFPVAYRQYQRVVSLPIYSKMTDADVSDVIEAVLATAGLARA